MYKAVIFDMDGVLINSTPFNLKSFNKALERYGVHIKEGPNRRYLGRSLRDQIKMVREDFNIKEEIDHDDFSKELLGYQLKLIKENLNPDKELVSFVKSLKEKGMKIAVATSSGKERAEKFLEFLEILPLLDTLITCEDVNNHKPHPDIYLETAKKLNVEPKDCIVFEDALNGIEAANKAGMKTVAVLTKFHTREEFTDADFVIDSIKDINRIFENLEEVNVDV